MHYNFPIKRSLKCPETKLGAWASLCKYLRIIKLFRHLTLKIHFTTPEARYYYWPDPYLVFKTRGKAVFPPNIPKIWYKSIRNCVWTSLHPVWNVFFIPTSQFANLPPKITWFSSLWALKAITLYILMHIFFLFTRITIKKRFFLTNTCRLTVRPWGCFSLLSGAFPSKQP